VADAHRRPGVAKVEDLDPASSRAVAEYLLVLDDAAFGGATPVEPKAISPTDPAARYIASANSVGAYAYSDTRHGRPMGFVGVNYEVSIPGIGLFFVEIHTLGGSMPVHRFLIHLDCPLICW
jgi:hypothetical protein